MTTLVVLFNLKPGASRDCLDGLVADFASPTMQRVAAEFQQFADHPEYIVSEPT